MPVYIPENRIIINNVDVCEKFKMGLLDGYELSPPEPKTYTVDIPGGNGVLDLTEALSGDIVYNNRHNKFTFLAVEVENPATLKTQLLAYFHGKTHEYELTMDPGYTYIGRFTIESIRSGVDLVYGNYVVMEIKTEDKPYKYRPKQVYDVNAIGGVMTNLKCGRLMVNPTFEIGSPTKIIFNNRTFNLNPGVYKMNTINLTEGDNWIYISSFTVKNIKWGDLKSQGKTWGDLASKPVFEWYKINGDGSLVRTTWAEKGNVPWKDVANETWNQYDMKDVSSSNIENVKIEYEWGEL